MLAGVANIVTWIDRQYAFAVGANWLQWLTSVVAFGGWGLYFHVRFGEDRCEHCWRKGSVPVKGAVHRHCRRHALEHGTVH